MTLSEQAICDNSEVETSAVTHMIAISEVEALELWSGLVIAGDGECAGDQRQRRQRGPNSVLPPVVRLCMLVPAVRHPGRRCRLGGQNEERDPDGDPALRDLTGNRVPMICCRAWTP